MANRMFYMVAKPSRCTTRIILLELRVLLSDLKNQALRFDECKLSMMSS